MEVLIFLEDELALGFTLSGRDICRHNAVGVRREALGKVGRGGRKRGLRVRGAVNARNAHAHLRGGAEIARQRNRHTGGQIDVALRVALNARRAGEHQLAAVFHIHRAACRRGVALYHAALDGAACAAFYIDRRTIDRFAAGDAHAVQLGRAASHIHSAAAGCCRLAAFNAPADHIQRAFLYINRSAVSVAVLVLCCTAAL